MRFSILCLLLCATMWSTTSYSQKKIPFEKVTVDELKMSSYEADTAAAAVILMDLGNFDGNELKFTRKLRVKILTKAGLDWGNWSFNTPTSGDFKVVTHNLVGNEIVSEKADSKSIHREEVIDGINIYKVFAPNVKVGSVIDITYSFFGVPFEWRFQERIPTVVNELILEEAQYIKYSKTFFGFQSIETISPIQWRARNMPAFRMEPFLSTYTNYLTKFEFQLESVGRAGVFYMEYSTTWRKVIENLLDHPNFGGILNSSGFLNDFAKETKAKGLSTEEMIKAAYNYVQQNIRWNGNESVLGSVGFRKNFQVDHSGNSADVNLALVTLLNKMDIAAYPVVLSTRENGLLVPFTPSLFKLNYVVAYVQHGTIDMLLDATDENIGLPGILPSRCLNGNGLMVKRDNEQWIGLNKGYAEVKRQFISITMESPTSVKARLTQDLSGYGYVEWADKLKTLQRDPEQVKNQLQRSHPDVTVMDYTIPKRDAATCTGKEVVELNLTDQVVDAGTGLLFTPFVFFEYADNPFKADERKHPVDLTFPRDLSTTIVLALPKDYSVKELPQSVKFSTPDGGASFTYMANATGSNVQFRAILKITKYVFTESEYHDLRMFFSEVSKIISTPIEFSKT